MESAFFAWVEANNIPFFAIFCAMIGLTFAALFAVAAALDAVATIYRKITSR